MKFAILFGFLVSSLAFADSIYKCDYRVVRKDGKILEFSGNIVPGDAALNSNGTTYLTLAPNELSGVALEARILFTSDDYNPITLHKPGQSAAAVSSTTIHLGVAGNLSYVDGNGVAYSVTCQPR